MKTLEDELIVHFGERLSPLTAQDLLPAGIGSPLRKLVESDYTIVFCREGFSVTSTPGETVTCRYGDRNILWPDLRTLMEMSRTGVGFLVINGPQTISIRLPAHVLTALGSVASHWPA